MRLRDFVLSRGVVRRTLPRTSVSTIQVVLLALHHRAVEVLRLAHIAASICAKTRASAMSTLVQASFSSLRKSTAIESSTIILSLASLALSSTRQFCIDSSNLTCQLELESLAQSLAGHHIIGLIVNAPIHGSLICWYCISTQYCNSNIVI